MHATLPDVKYNSATHHRRSIRLRAYDYCAAGGYFVTICTYERECMLRDRRARLVVDQTWRSMSRRVKGIRTGEFIVMPNHIHGIIWIRPPNRVGAQHPRSRYGMAVKANHPQTVSPSVATGAAPLRLAIVSGALGVVVRTFKSQTARRINEIRGTPGTPVWQRNYHERVIRNERELEAIRQYIRDNPAKWAEDSNNPERA